MGSIPSKAPLADELRRIIEVTTREVAFEERLPWGLDRLRESSRECTRTAGEEIIAKSRALGMPAKDVAPGAVYEAACRAAKGLRGDAEAGELLPTDEQIKEALETFSTQEWRDLVGEFRREDLQILRAYVSANLVELETTLGLSKLRTIRGACALRGVFLALRGQKLVPVSDPMWAAIIRQDTTARNIACEPSPTKRLSMAELGGDSNIAKMLGVTDKRVADWQVARVKELMRNPALHTEVYDYHNMRTVKYPAELVVDATGVGRPVVDMLRKENLSFSSVLITGGDVEHREHGFYRVPKRNLVSAVQVALQSGHLKIAEELTLAETLRKELLNFRIKVNISTAHDSYEAWREGDHDDLVLATALACWRARKRQGATVFSL